jgi:putative membrane protein
VGFIVRVLVNAATIALAAALIPGIHLDGPLPALLAGVVLGLVNALVRPVLVILTLPLTLLTLGLFLLVLNGLCLAMTAWLVPGFDIDGLLSAVLGALLVSVVSWALTAFVRTAGASSDTASVARGAR